MTIKGGHLIIWPHPHLVPRGAQLGSTGACPRGAVGPDVGRTSPGISGSPDLFLPLQNGEVGRRPLGCGGTKHRGRWAVVSLRALPASSGPPRPGKCKGRSQHTHMDSGFPPALQTEPPCKHCCITSRLSLNPANAHRRAFGPPGFPPPCQQHTHPAAQVLP